MDEYGLCFAGGGGKGAYELGVWKALTQLGITHGIKAVSGSSIGAVNGLFFALKKLETAEMLWDRIGEKTTLLGTTDMNAIRERLIEILNTEVDYDYVRVGDIKLYVTAAIMEKDMTFPESIEQLKDYVENYRDYFDIRYYKLNELFDAEIKNRILASTALPVIYKPVFIGSEKAVDGGLIDNVPIRPLIEEENLKKLIVVMCSNSNEYDLYLASRADEIIEIRPSRYIGDLVDGTLDFSPRSVRKRKLLGFYDTLRTFDILNRKKLGIPYSEAEKAVLAEKDYQRVLTELEAGMAVKKSQDTMKQYDNLLKKYSSKYGIDL